MSNVTSEKTCTERQLPSTCGKSMMQGVCLQSESNAENEVRTEDFHSSEMTSGHYNNHEQTGVREKDCTEQSADTREHDLSSDEE